MQPLARAGGAPTPVTPSSSSRPLRGAANARVPLTVLGSAAEIDRRVARHIGDLIEGNNRRGRNTVLGLATGSTPLGVYRELIRLHREEGLDFSRVVTFNLDEYYPLPPGHAESYHRYMQEKLFAHVNIDPRNVHLPPGNIPRGQVAKACADYEAAIRRAGGIDLQLLGIGRTGHIGFNEPGSAPDSRTRWVELHDVTRQDAAEAFGGKQNVPRGALTMGIGTILDAREVLLIATGEKKADIVRRTVQQAPDARIPATQLQRHRNVRFLLDPAAAGKLGPVGPRAGPALETRRVTLADGKSTTVHVARYDLRRWRPRLAQLSPPEKLVDWCARNGEREAFTGGFFIRTLDLPLGLFRNGGRTVRCVPVKEPYGDRRPVLALGPQGAAILQPSELERVGSHYPDLLQAGPLLVKRGREVFDSEADFEGFRAGADQFDDDITGFRAPRVAVGLDGQQLIVAACDGRKPGEAGLDMEELAKVMKDLGAHEAMNLDGGSSASLVTGGALKNQPWGAPYLAAGYDVPYPRGRGVTSAVVLTPREPAAAAPR